MRGGQLQRSVEGVPSLEQDVGRVGAGAQIERVVARFVDLAGGLVDDRLVDAVEFVAEVFGDVVERGEQVGHACAEHFDERRRFAGLAVRVLVGEFAPAVLQERADLEFAGDRRAVVLDVEVDVPAAVAGLLGVLDVVAFGVGVETERLAFGRSAREVLEGDLHHLDVAQVGAGEAQADEVVDDAWDVVDRRHPLAIAGLHHLAPGAPLRLHAAGEAADAGEVAVGECVVESALERVHRTVEGWFEDIGAIRVVPTPELRVAEPRLVALLHHRVTLRVIARGRSGPIT